MDAVWNFLDGASRSWWLIWGVCMWFAVFWWAFACQMVDVIQWVKNLRYRKMMRRTAEIRKKRLG